MSEHQCTEQIANTGEVPLNPGENRDADLGHGARFIRARTGGRSDAQQPIACIRAAFLFRRAELSGFQQLASRLQITPESEVQRERTDDHVRHPVLAM